MKSLKLIMPLAIALLMTSCVSKKQYADLKTNYDKLQTEHAGLQKDYNDAQVRIAEYTSDSKSLAARLAEEQQRNKELRDAYANLQGSYQDNIKQGNVNISKLVDEINASNKFIKQLVDAKTKSDSLNQALTNKLTRSLTREEMNDVDVQVLKGVVYISLADNMLYKSGSYEIGSRAGETLEKIAKIISDYKDYDVLIEGNTDNVPINQKNIRNNWDLSALRASSVVQALQNPDHHHAEARPVHGPHRRSSERKLNGPIQAKPDERKNTRWLRVPFPQKEKQRVTIVYFFIFRM